MIRCDKCNGSGVGFRMPTPDGDSIPFACKKCDGTGAIK